MSFCHFVKCLGAFSEIIFLNFCLGFQEFRPVVFGGGSHGDDIRAHRLDRALQRLQLVRAQLLHRRRHLHLRLSRQLHLPGKYSAP
jgi:hypothetical protein